MDSLLNEQKFWDGQVDVLLGHFIKQDPGLFYDRIFDGSFTAAFNAWVDSLDEQGCEGLPLSGVTLRCAIASVKAKSKIDDTEFKEETKNLLSKIPRAEFIAKTNAAQRLV